jgi:hypothetical protein
MSACIVCTVRPTFRSLSGLKPLLRTALIAAAMSVCGTAVAADRLSLVDGQLDVRAAATRAGAATDLLSEVNAVLVHLAPPTSAERAAVTSELASIGALEDPVAVNARMHQLQRTVPYQKDRLHIALTTVKEALECAADSQSGTRREMSCWAIAAYHLSDRNLFDDAIPVLRKAGAFQAGEGAAALKWASLRMRMNGYGRGIQENLVIPYLKGDIPAGILQAARPR